MGTKPGDATVGNMAAGAGGTTVSCMTRDAAMQWCGCMRPQTPREALRDIWGEVREFVAEPSWDEASDIAYGVGRLLGGLRGRVYVAVPGDGWHVTKIQARMREYGCIRSKRHLRDGACPAQRRE